MAGSAVLAGSERRVPDWEPRQRFGVGIERCETSVLGLGEEVGQRGVVQAGAEAAGPVAQVFEFFGQNGEQLVDVIRRAIGEGVLTRLPNAFGRVEDTSPWSRVGAAKILPVLDATARFSRVSGPLP